MLEKPKIRDEAILTCLQREYGLYALELVFLPLGADLNTAVYRAVTQGGIAYFVKLRSGAFDETSVRLPKALSDQGITQIIPPLATNNGQLWGNVDKFKLILYPFVEGRNGYEMEFSDAHWVEFGRALKQIHNATLPEELLRHIKRETYPSRWREEVREFLSRVEHETFHEPVAEKLSAALRARRNEIHELVERAERLAQTLQSRQQEFIVCHSDLHAGNLLITADDHLYIVDWDDVILAPRERDLMYAGGGQFGARHTPEEEERLFYSGYGPVQVDPLAQAYYRYERIVQDIAVECEQIFETDQGGADREQEFEYFMSNFLPNGVLEIARHMDRAL